MSPATNNGNSDNNNKRRASCLSAQAALSAQACEQIAAQAADEAFGDVRATLEGAEERSRARVAAAEQALRDTLMRKKPPEPEPEPELELVTQARGGARRRRRGAPGGTRMMCHAALGSRSADQNSVHTWITGLRCHERPRGARVDGDSRARAPGCSARVAGDDNEARARTTSPCAQRPRGASPAAAAPPLTTREVGEQESGRVEERAASLSESESDADYDDAVDDTAPSSEQRARQRVLELELASAGDPEAISAVLCSLEAARAEDSRLGSGAAVDVDPRWGWGSARANMDPRWLQAVDTESYPRGGGGEGGVKLVEDADGDGDGDGNGDGFGPCPTTSPPRIRTPRGSAWRQARAPPAHATSRVHAQHCESRSRQRLAGLSIFV